MDNSYNTMKITCSIPLSLSTMMQPYRFSIIDFLPLYNIYIFETKCHGPKSVSYFRMPNTFISNPSVKRTRRFFQGQATIVIPSQKISFNR